VSEAPSGLILKDVKTILRKESFWEPSGANEINVNVTGQDVLRVSEEKLVAFEEINEIELTEVAEEADSNLE
jgi:hypothetical protein